MDESINGESRGIVSALENPVTAWIILSLFLVFTISAFGIANSFLQQRFKENFVSSSEVVVAAIKERSWIYEQVLWGGAGLFNASQSVERDEWKKFINSIDISRRWPGVQGVGYSMIIKPEGKQAFIDQVQSEGFPQFTIKPEGNRDLYTAIVYLEPFDWRNQRAFGYDMWTNEVRRKAMEQARDDGRAVTSGMITLVQETAENVQKGFLTFIPIYAIKDIPSTVEERRKNIVGWVYSPFRIKDYLNEIVSKKDTDIEFAIFDGPVATKETLMFVSEPSFKLEDAQAKAKLEMTTQIDLQGHPWTVYFYQNKGLMTQSERDQLAFLVVGWLILDLMLIYVIFSILSIQRRARNIAAHMTSELDRAKKDLEVKVKERTKELENIRDHLEQQVKQRTSELQDQMRELEHINKTMVGREVKMIELKEEIERLKKRQENV